MNMVIKKFIKLYKNASIKYKLLLLFYVQIIIPLIFIGFMSYQKSSEIIKNKSITYSQDLLSMIEVRLNDMWDNLNSLSLDVLYDRRIYDALSISGDEKERLSYYNNLTEINNILRKTTLSREEIQSMCLVSKSGYMYYFDSNSRKAIIRQVMPYDDVLKAARKDGGKLSIFLGKENGKVQNVFAARIIKNKDNFEEVGLLVMLLKNDYLQSIYQDLSRDAIQNISIIADNNEEIISKDSKYSYLLDSFYDKNIHGKRGYYIDKNENMLVSYAPIEKLHWTVVAHIWLKSLYKEIDVLKRCILILVMLSLAVLSVLSLLTSIDIVEPINKMVAAMKNVEKGQKYETVNLGRNDELGYMSESFNKMSKKIDYLVNSIYKEQITRKEAELKALQAQINPHFLFNTLESVNWMAQLNGVPQISETVTALASILDANIGRDDKLITLGDELNYINNYIAIIKNRYEDRLQVIKSIDESLLQINIPRLLIQPLIENAVYHGIEKSTRDGIIELKVSRDASNVVIEVTDNGAGMKEDELKMINERLAADVNTFMNNSGNEKRKSIGLENVNRRIKLFYGEEYGLNMNSVFGEYTKVKVTIPGEVMSKGGNTNV